MSQSNVVEGLISVLLNFTADLSERDDAAMDLGEFDNEEALSALYQVAKDHEENETLVSSCGESIAQIWLRRDYCNVNILELFHPTAYSEALSLISSQNKNLLHDKK